MGETSWIFLIVGSFAAVGAALALGTLAALIRYHRTGSFPRHDGDEGPAGVTTGKLVALWSRVVVGAVLTVVGVSALARSGLL